MSHHSSSSSSLCVFATTRVLACLSIWDVPSLQLFVLTAIPTLIGYWTITSNFGPRINEKVKLPGKPIEHYIEFKDEDLRRQYRGKKMPMQILYDAYFADKLDFKGASCRSPPLTLVERRAIGHEGRRKRDRDGVRA